MMRWLALSMLLPLAAGGCVTKKKYDAQVQLSKMLQRELDRAKARNRKLENKVSSLEKALAEVRAKVKELEEDAIRLSRRFRAKLQATQKELEELARARREAEERARMFRELTAKFQKLIDAGTLSIKIVHGRMVLKLKSAVLFDPGKARLKRDGKKTLAEIARVLRTIRGKHFQVAGHTDDRPVKRSRYKDNWALSTARAVTVVRFLQEQGVPPENLSAAGFSQYQPVASNATPDGRRQNRRIEITLLPTIPRGILQGK